MRYFRNGKWVEDGNTPTEYHSVGFMRRVLAGALDCALLVVALMVLLAVPGIANTVAYQILNIALPFLYYACSLGLKSRTIGQSVFGQTTVSLQYMPLTWYVSIKRAAWTLTSYLLLGLPLLTILFTSKKQAFHDIASGTLVVDAHAYLAERTLLKKAPITGNSE